MVRRTINQEPGDKPLLTTEAVGPTFTGVMPLTIPSDALRHMSEAERAQLLEAAFAVSPAAVANYLLVLEARLRAFEQRYELPSHRVGEALQRGELRDTKDVSEWLFWVDVRSHLAGQART